MKKKKRLVVCNKHGLTHQVELDFLTDEELFIALDDVANKLGVNIYSLVVFTLGTEEEMNEGYIYFCPRCGRYQDKGIKPQWELLYQMDENSELSEAGQFKVLNVDCKNCEDTFYVNTEKFQAERVDN